MFALNGNTVSWKSSKYEMTVDSIIESEYIVVSDCSLGSGLDKLVHL